MSSIMRRVVAMAEGPSSSTFTSQTILVASVALFFAVLCMSAAIIHACRGCYRRRSSNKGSTSRLADLEHQTYDADDSIEDGSLFLYVPTLSHSWPASPAEIGSAYFSEKHSPDLRTPPLAIAPSSHVRDSVLCKALSELAWPSPRVDKVSHPLGAYQA
ncbi:hypothetical protein C8Q78DRAFT_1080274 [Trametes maxima]|nr:hypothetical protein C8Q78DRAFT_1080274 [Trametes maxima]